MRDVLKILLFADNRPGHVQLAEGVIAAISHCRPVDVLRVDVARSVLFPNRLLARLLTTAINKKWLLSVAYNVDVNRLEGRELIVSSGGNTLGANILAARLLGAVNIFYGSLRQFDPLDIALALTSYEHHTTHPNIVAALKPSSLDPDEFPAYTSVDEVPRTLGVLIGGDGSGLFYTQEDWIGLLNFCQCFHDAFASKFIVANSRRTPHKTSDLIAQFAARNGAFVEFIDVRTAGPGTLPPLFAQSEVVLASADSSSMVSEAIWLRRPTLALYPMNGRLEHAEAVYRAQLVTKGHLAEISIEDLTPRSVLTHLTALTPMRNNPRQSLADLLRKRLPTLFGDLPSS
ncbi:MAG: mitochondrial fission ELM1 family protein [Hyphomicrobiaceae bacterium]|nr:mitochondrial fission ELM1 family protein [Hyphomicrobiaceae bacterium]MCC0011152.1 mitochondrial fission ELM1 family protein [Hyphomicrobiaceae bacterium]